MCHSCNLEKVAIVIIIDNLNPEELQEGLAIDREPSLKHPADHLLTA
jgi:hypothetical protein